MGFNNDNGLFPLPESDSDPDSERDSCTMQNFPLVWIRIRKYMSHFAYACKMRYPLNLVLENIEYL